MKDTIVKILTDERNSARKALSIYGDHISPCPGRPCECGFKQAWDSAKLPQTFGSVIDARAALVKIAGTGRVPVASRKFDNPQYRAGYCAGYEDQADIARSALIRSAE